MSELISKLAVAAAKQAALDPALANALGMGVGGAALGAGLGGLSGFMGDGKEELDENGNPVKKRSGGILSGLGGALGGGIIGGLGGAAIGGLGTEAIRKYGPEIKGTMDQNDAKGRLGQAINKPINGFNDLGNIAKDIYTATGTEKFINGVGYDLKDRAGQFAELPPIVSNNPASRLGNAAADYASELGPMVDNVSQMGTKAYNYISNLMPSK
jgi:hypothetical protein